MQVTYGALLVAGAFAFLPDRTLGGLLRTQILPLFG